MAYVPTRTTYRLVFADPEQEGLEVVTLAGSLGQYLEIAKLADLDWSPPYTVEKLAPVHDLFKTFETVLLAWNIEQPAGVPVPATAEGFRSLELTLAQAVINAWMDAVAGALPLDGGDLAETLPMEVSP